MRNIEKYNTEDLAPISYAKKENYTERIEKFVQYLHDFKPIIEQEFDNLLKKSETKPCKAFDDKLKNLSAIYKAEKDLYYWYIENKKRQG